MRMSCNGCRVLRKGCSENCSIRPCLQWIKNPESQANATVFLAKFYGRAGLMNLINSGPEHLRPAIFRSLLYEACGRIVNPIYGSVGLLWSGSWQMCQAAVEAVLKGAPIVQIPSETAAAAPSPSPPLKAYDIRHVSKDDASLSGAQDLHKVGKATRTRFKRSAPKPKPSVLLETEAAEPVEADFCNSARTVSRDSSAAGESRENESAVSGETAEASMVGGCSDDGEVELELTLGFEPAAHCRSSSASRENAPKRCDKPRDVWGSDMCTVDLALDLAA